VNWSAFEPKVFPSSCEEGWPQQRPGVVAHKPGFGVNDHPVCGAKVGFAEIFLMPQPPLLTRRGIILIFRNPLS
jgi:hypothetical protein